jgi:Flp pilus assembly pilin Flp
MRNFAALIRDENGATVIEYGLLVAAIAIPLMIGLIAVVESLNSNYNAISSNLKGR